MAAMIGADAGLAAKFAAIFPHLDERQRRLLMGAEARTLGHGGVRKVARAAGVREATVSAGVAELESGQAPLGRVRRAGGGRKRLIATDPGLRPALLALVEPTERQGRVKVGNVRSDLRRWSTLGPVRRLSLPYGSLPARSAPTFRPGQSGLAIRCAGQHDHVDSSPQLVLGGIHAAQMPTRRL